METICPHCSRPLTAADAESIVCAGCAARFEVVGGVPMLIPATESDQHAHQRRYFDAEFAAYGTYEIENWRASFLRRIFAALAIPRTTGTYLDVGVGGSGATVIEAARLGMPAVGCDLSVEGVLTANAFAVAQGVADNVSFVVCAAERLPFADAAFACASAVAVLEHLDDDGEAVRELARVIEPGGLLWVTVPHAFRYMPPPMWPVYWVHDRRIGHKRHYDLDRLTGLLSASGFEFVSVEFSGHAVKLLQFGLSKLSAGVRASDSKLWWSLEERDQRAAARPWGALQLNAVFRRKG